MFTRPNLKRAIAPQTYVRWELDKFLLFFVGVGLSLFPVPCSLFPRRQALVTGY